jgi:hypothetical protein
MQDGSSIFLESVKGEAMSRLVKHLVREKSNGGNSEVFLFWDMRKLLWGGATPVYNNF